MTALESLLAAYRDAAATHREAGTYFEELTLAYFRNEPKFHELYREVLPFADWAGRRGLDKRDTGIDLVAETFANESHAIQCKLYPPDYRLRKEDIDSFFTASGKTQFTRRIIVTTTNHWSEHAEDALRDQQPPVTKIDLAELEKSVIDWSRYAPRRPPARPEAEEDAPAAPARRPRESDRRSRNARPRQADHGVRHREDVRQPEDRGGARR